MNAVRSWEDLTGRPPRIAGKSTAGATAEMTHRPYRGRRISWDEFYRQHPHLREKREAANDNRVGGEKLAAELDRPAYDTTAS